MNPDEKGSPSRVAQSREGTQTEASGDPIRELDWLSDDPRCE